MFNSFIGSFIRTFGRILAYIIFGYLISLLFNNIDVFALTGSYDSAYYSIRYTPTSFCNYDPFYRSLRYSGFTQSSSWTSLDTSIDNDCQFLGLLYLHTRGNFSSGNTYTFRFTIDFYDSQDSQKFLLYFGVYDVLGSITTNSSSATTENISNFSYRIKEGSNPNRMLVYVSFTPSTNLKYLGVRLVPKDLMPLSNSSLSVSSNKLPYQTILYTYLQITYEEGSNALIQNQTNVIQNQTDRLINQFDDFMNIFQLDADKTEDIYLNDTENSDGTCGGILCNLKKVVKGVINFPQTILTAIVDGLKALFIPSDFSFLDDFRNSIESKLGFIASIPIQVIEFTLNLVNVNFEEFNSISFPKIEFFGVCFWEDIEIDLSEAIGIINTFKYFTDLICVCLCVNTLVKWYDNFTGGVN